MNTNHLPRYLSEPVRIKDKRISPCIVLAPMAGLGHIAFRHLVSEFGGFGLLFTGMCSAKALPHENPATSLVFKWRKKELSFLVCQIFGSDPVHMAAAARRIEKEGFFGVDLNFGCSVAAICKKGCGAALLKHPDQCIEIVTAVREAVSIPVFVKYRTGWNHDPDFAVAMAKRFEDCGADAITFHPRVAPDRRSRPPKWDIIRQVTQAVRIPVFGNGNLFEPSDGVKMFEQTGCQGLSVGRMAVARPWLFAQWSGKTDFSNHLFYKTASRYTTILSEHYDDYFAVKFFKKFLPYFCANFKFGHQILKRLLSFNTMADIQMAVDEIFASDPEVLLRPNLNMMV